MRTNNPTEGNNQATDDLLSGKKITLLIGEKEVKFCVSIDDYNSFLDNVKDGERVLTAHRLLERCAVDDYSRDMVATIYAQAATMEVCSALIAEFKPKLEICVKK